MPRPSPASSGRSLATAEQRVAHVRWADPQVGNQAAGFAYGPAPTVFSGGYGAGKTYLMLLKLLFACDLFPGYRVAIVRRVWEELKKTTMATFFKMVPPAAYTYSGRRNDQDKVLQLNNGSTILWLYLEHPDAATILGGLEINAFGMDQAEEIEEETFDKLCSRTGRWDGAQVPARVIDWYERTRGRRWPWRNNDDKPVPPMYQLLTCNPDTEFHWIYRRFHPDSSEHYALKVQTDPADPWSLKSYHDLGYKMFTMDSRRNRFLTKQNLEQLVRKDASFVARYVAGQWGMPEGRIHSVDARSIIPGDPVFVKKLLDTCLLYRVLDHGDTSPTCCLWAAVDKDRNLFFFREYYMGGKRVSEHRANIAGMSGPEQYVAMWGDPRIFDAFRSFAVGKAGQSATKVTIYDEYIDCVSQPRSTALFMQPADNNEMGTRNRINELLVVQPERIHPYTREMGAPRVFFVQRSDQHPNGCDFAIRELRAQRRNKLGTDLGKPVYSDDRQEGIPDHAYDCIRYFVASPAVAPVMVEAKRGYTAADARASIKALNRQGGKGWSRLFTLARVDR